MKTSSEGFKGNGIHLLKLIFWYEMKPFFTLLCKDLSSIFLRTREKNFRRTDLGMTILLFADRSPQWNGSDNPTFAPKFPSGILKILTKFSLKLFCIFRHHSPNKTGKFASNGSFGDIMRLFLQKKHFVKLAAKSLICAVGIVNKFP